MNTRRLLHWTSLFVILLPGLAISYDNSSLISGQTPPTPYGQRILRTDTPGLKEGESAAFWYPAPDQDKLDKGTENKTDKAAENKTEAPTASNSNQSKQAKHQQYLQAIDTLEGTLGPYAAELSQTFASLAYSLQESQEHEAAIEAFKRAGHIKRINEGLYTPEQIPLIRGMLASFAEMDNFEALDKGNDYLFFVQRQAWSVDSPERLAAMKEYSRWQRHAYLSRRGVDKFKRLVKLYELFEDEAERLEETDEHHPNLIDIYYQQLEIEYLLDQYDGEEQLGFTMQVKNQQPSPFDARQESKFKQIDRYGYQRGKRVLSKIKDILDQAPTPSPEAEGRYLLALADWHTWFNKFTTAKRLYGEAYAILAELPNHEHHFDQVHELPIGDVFQPGRLNRPAKRLATVTLKFDVSNRGKTRNLEFLAVDSPKDSAAKTQTKQLLKNMRFRPRIIAGETAATEGLTREYRLRF